MICFLFSQTPSVHQEEARAKYEANFEAYEQGNLGGFRRIYPKGGNEAKYEKFFDQNTSLCSETVASKARAEMARQLREELEAKQREMEKYVVQRLPATAILMNLAMISLMI